MTDSLVFDVNQTLLDLGALRPHFESIFKDGRVMGEWFGLMLRQSLVATITGDYRPFDVLGADALIMTAKKHHLELETAAIETVMGAMLKLPPHSDAIPALTRLRDAGYRLATLTNSSSSAVASQLEHANLTDFFERQFSVEAVGRFKPAPETYHYAAQQLGVGIGDIWLIAAHDWDVTGAKRAGAKTAFVAREGMVLGDLAPTPDVSGPDLVVIADQLLAK